MNDRVTLRERLKELRRKWTGQRQEVRLTTIGWRPDETYIQDTGKTASGEVEYYKVIRQGEKEHEHGRKKHNR